MLAAPANPLMSSAGRLLGLPKMGEIPLIFTSTSVAAIHKPDLIACTHREKVRELKCKVQIAWMGRECVLLTTSSKTGTLPSVSLTRSAARLWIKAAIPMQKTPEFQTSLHLQPCVRRQVTARTDVARRATIAHARAPSQVRWRLVLVSSKSACELAGRGRRGSSYTCNNRVWIKMLVEFATASLVKTI